MITTSEWITKFLLTNKCSGAFYLSGGMIAFIIDELAKQSDFPLTQCNSEQAAGFAAEAASRITNFPSVALATSGPGVTNLATPIASCYFDSTPVVFITGQVNTKDLRENPSQRQKGFQELDPVQLYKSITKFAHSVRSVDEIPEIFKLAWETTLEGRPGPCLIDIPINIQYQLLNECNHDVFEKQYDLARDNSGVYQYLNESIAKSKRPLIIAGGGIRVAGSVSNFRNFVQKLEIPVVTSLMGLDCLNYESNNFAGFIGTYGNPWANEILLESDLLLVLGSRLDTRQIPSQISNFAARNVDIIRIDIDRNELEFGPKSSVNFEINLKDFLADWKNIEFKGSRERMVSVKEGERINSHEKFQNLSPGINPNKIIEVVAKYRSDTKGYLVDVGQHQMWAAQSLKIGERQRFITSGGLGAMGFSLPALIGAYLVNGGNWNVIIGDGCLKLSIAELETLVRLDVKAHIYLMNNSQLGMITQFQDTNLESRHVGSRLDYNNYDFCKVAETIGITSIKITSLVEFIEILESREFHNQLVLFDIQIPQNAMALPKT